MRHAAVRAVSLMAIALFGCGKPIEPKDKGMADIKKIAQRWMDGTEIAKATARIALAPQVANLQSIKRDLDGLVVGECLKEAKVALGEAMEQTIRGFLEFMQNKNAWASADVEEGWNKFFGYKQAIGKFAKNSHILPQVLSGIPLRNI